MHQFLLHVLIVLTHIGFRSLQANLLLDESFCIALSFPPNTIINEWFWTIGGLVGLEHATSLGVIFFWSVSANYSSFFSPITHKTTAIESSPIRLNRRFAAMLVKSITSYYKFFKKSSRCHTVCDFAEMLLVL